MSALPTEVVVQSPGRINLIGEHTDYNAGWVLPAAIDRYITVTVSRHDDPQHCSWTALDMAETFEFSLDGFQPQASGWTNHVLGVVDELQRTGPGLGGFRGEISGNIPVGGGMSSSAALENAVGLALNELFHLGRSRMDLVQISQNAEHRFVGTRCGIMDMFASMMGREGQVILLDCRSLAYTYHPLYLGEYALVLLNTQVAHALADTAYNTRREECEEAVRLLRKHHGHVRSLRDLTVSQLPEILPLLPEPIDRRCRHVVWENDRVRHTVAALQRGDLRRVGKLLYDSHASLQNDYAVSCAELDFLVGLARSDSRVLGSRMMGGGFGGCTLNLLLTEAIPELIDQFSAAYRGQFGRDLVAYQVRPVNGTEVRSRQF